MIRNVLLSIPLVLITLSLIVPRCIGSEGSGINENRAEISTLWGLVQAFKIDTGRYPTTREGLGVLLVKPPNTPGWGGPYSDKELPRDEWGNPYVYTAPRSGDSFGIVSYGADGKPGGEGQDADIGEGD